MLMYAQHLGTEDGQHVGFTKKETEWKKFGQATNNWTKEGEGQGRNVQAYIDYILAVDNILLFDVAIPPND